MINSSAPLVLLDLAEGRAQVTRVIDLVDQTEPSTSFDPRFEGHQHALRPDIRFHPGPAAPGISGLFSPYRHCRTVAFRIPLRHAFHLPVPLGSTPVTAFLSYYGDSDSSEGLPPSRGLPASRHTSLKTILPPITQRPPIAAFTRYPLARWVSPRGVQASPFAGRLAGYVKPNRVRLLRTGLSPPVALHIAWGDAVTFGFQAGERMPGKDLHLHTCALAGAPASPLRGGWGGLGSGDPALKRRANQIFAPSGRALEACSRAPCSDAHKPQSE